MKFKKIPKRSGGHRLICIPHKAQKAELRSLLVDGLNYKQIKYCDSDIVHGFIPTKSVITNAFCHLGYNYTFSTDIADFFDSGTPDMVRDYLTEEEISKCFIDGRAYQGLPTSPAVLNLAVVKMDEEIKAFLSSLSYPVIYTRYADDMAFSCNIYQFYQLLKVEIPIITAKYGFQIKESKNRLQDSRYGLREVTGVMVGKDKLSLSRKFKKILRAAKHKKTLSVSGLEEWAKLRFPHKYLPEEQLMNLYNSAKLDYNTQMFINHASPIVKDLKQVVDRLSNYNTDPLRRDKEYVKGKIKSELSGWKKITKEKLKLVSRQPIREKLKAELEKEKLAEISLDVC